MTTDQIPTFIKSAITDDIVRRCHELAVSMADVSIITPIYGAIYWSEQQFL